MSRQEVEESSEIPAREEKEAEREPACIIISHAAEKVETLPAFQNHSTQFNSSRGLSSGRGQEQQPLFNREEQGPVVSLLYSLTWSFANYSVES